MSELSKVLANEHDDYAGSHKAPTNNGYAEPLHACDKIFPDIYGPIAFREYGYNQWGDAADSKMTIAIVQRAKGNPNFKVKIYRAIPKILSSEDRVKELEAQKAYMQKTGKIPPEKKRHLSGNASIKNRSDYYEFISQQIETLKEKPEAEEPKHQFNRGDWVTISPAYAKRHGEAHVADGNFKVISKTVPASSLWTDGGSIQEWGYDPS